MGASRVHAPDGRRVSVERSLLSRPRPPTWHRRHYTTDPCRLHGTLPPPDPRGVPDSEPRSFVPQKRPESRKDLYPEDPTVPVIGTPQVDGYHRRRPDIEREESTHLPRHPGQTRVVSSRVFSVKYINPKIIRKIKHVKNTVEVKKRKFLII